MSFLLVVFPLDAFSATLSDVQAIMGGWNGSVNFYMFQGGTNFGFLNGANFIFPKFPYNAFDTTSYGK